ncbi:mevalonate kinase [Acidianus sp. RZ1]|uniref:mevalonate kinase n=1 Tax=Acidianus sp. RZ1 TaxID=1540082 RepID=UPI0014916985|nr:mevalonate kinase [Acidianus sp. RZ1]NON61264.1 mevalonate kinase [Acidianus sp. RZ1]
MITVEVPLKATLFGEHAVVYGEPAIAMTISEKMVIRIMESDKLIFKSNSLAIKGVKVELDGMKLESEEASRILSYVIHAVDHFGKRKPALIDVESPVEPSVGLGTSAGIIVGIVSAYSKFLGYQLCKEEIAKISHKVELEVQGIGSRMDTNTISIGGLLYFKREGGYEKINKEVKISAGYIKRTSTTAEILKRVKALKEKDEDLFKEIITTIGKTVDRAKKAIENDDREELGNLMYVNHGLLMSLGITIPPIDEMVSSAKTLGIQGCKISGGGGGGLVVCTEDERSKILLSYIGAKLINSKQSNEGVMIKEITQ